MGNMGVFSDGRVICFPLQVSIPSYTFLCPFSDRFMFCIGNHSQIFRIQAIRNTQNSFGLFNPYWKNMREVYTCQDMSIPYSTVSKRTYITSLVGQDLR